MKNDKAYLFSLAISLASCVGFYAIMLSIGHNLVKLFNLSENSINLFAIATVAFSYTLIFISYKISYKILKEKPPKKEIKNFKSISINNLSSQAIHPTDFIFTMQNVKGLEISK